MHLEDRTDGGGEVMGLGWAGLGWVGFAWLIPRVWVVVLFCFFLVLSGLHDFKEVGAESFFENRI